MRLPIRLPKSQRYYIPSPAPAFVRLRRRLTGRPVPDFPRTVQIQTVSGCNADCVFCPYGSTFSTAPHGRMSWELYDRILEECAGRRIRRISPYMMNEPLLDPEIWQRVRAANRLLPGVKVTLTTNGSLLDDKAVSEILSLGSGLHELAVSVQGSDEKAYSETMRGRLDLPETVENVTRLASEMRRRRARRPALCVTMVGTRLIDVPRALDFWKRRGVTARVTPLDNQGGLVTIGSELPLGMMVPNEPCPRPHKQAYVTLDGKVVVCCADYRRSVVLGDLKSSTLAEIWNGPLAVSIRRSHIQRDRKALPPLCRDCRIDRKPNGRDLDVEP